uniref:Uncharacterized protein AlNc14C156G7662 n=1 Tax=Albugo laibachii Nc14 TaxID=890382 RepID=F0WMH2_9STRA|nr:conserved hypothetical protein [Albugo laibachii Nc14]|eukprot:CCA22504.1 conserved hypothetical protein [Albugo laibachii Nc14]
MDNDTSYDQELKFTQDDENKLTEEIDVNEDTETVENLTQVDSKALQPVISNVVQILHDNMQQSWANALGQITHKYDCSLSEFTNALPSKPTHSDSNDNVRFLIQEQQDTRNPAKEAQHTFRTLQSEHHTLTEKLNIYRLVTTEFRRELLSERLAHIDSLKEIDELRSMMSLTRTESLVNKNEDVSDPWHNASVQNEDRVREQGSNEHFFTSFYSASTENNEHDFGEDDNMSYTLSAQRSLQSRLMDQYLPSTLLDSPQAPSHSQSFQYVDEEKKAVEGSEDTSETAKCDGCGNISSVMATKGQECDRNVAQNDEKSPHNSDIDTDTQENMENVSRVSPTVSSTLTEIFEFMPMKDIEKVLQQTSGETSAAVNYILRNHPSLNPSVSFDPSTQRPNLARSTSGNPFTSASNNWKTELCVYYLQGKCNKTRRTCSFAHGEEDLMRPNRGKLLTNPAYKSRVCPLFMEGNCPKSRRDCQLAHGEADLREGLALLSATPNLMNAAPRQQNYKTELCLFYLRGNCNYAKQECRFAHGEADIRTVQDNALELIQRSVSYTSSGSVKASEKGAQTSPFSARAIEGAAIQAQHRYQQQYQEQYQQSRRLPLQTIEGARDEYVTSQSFVTPQTAMSTSVVGPPSYPHHPQYQVSAESMHAFPMQYTSQQLNTPTRFMQQNGIYQHRDVPHHSTQQYQQVGTPNSQVSGHSLDPRTPQNSRYSTQSTAYRR